MSYTTSVILVVFASIMAALGQLNLKIGSARLEKNIREIIKNYALLRGIFFYGASAIIGIIALRGAELTVLYPIASLNYVWVSFLSMRFLREKMNIYKWLGVLMIIIGVSVIL